MTALNKQALREAAQKAGSDKWQAKKISGDFYVIRSGSFAKQYGITSYRPIAEIEHKPVRDYVAAASPATMLELLDELEAEKNMREAAEKRIAELEGREIKPVAWIRNTNATSFMSRFTTDENYAVEQWGNDAVALYASPVGFKLACFTDERNLKYINEKGRETSLIWSERNSEDGDVQLFRAAGIGVKGE